MQLTSQSVTPFIIGLPLGILTYDLIRHATIDEKRKPLVALCAVVTCGAITTGLKYAVNRPRPFVTYPDIIKKEMLGQNHSLLDIHLQHLH